MKLTPQNWIWEQTVPERGWLARSLDGLAVWQARLDDAPEIEARLVSLFSADECARRARLQQPGDRQRFCIGRGLLRLLTGAHLGIAPARLQFNYGTHGKPVVRGFEDSFHFNVSHSGDLVLLAFHSKREIGVDVEQVRATPDLPGLAREIFPASEYVKWLQLDADNQIAAFYRAWTRHEAALKALGTGLAGRQATVAKPRLEWTELALPEGYQGFVCFCERYHIIAS